MIPGLKPAGRPSYDPRKLFVSKSLDGREAIYEYDLAEKELGELVFAHPVFDADRLVFDPVRRKLVAVFQMNFSGVCFTSTTGPRSAADGTIESACARARRWTTPTGSGRRFCWLTAETIPSSTSATRRKWPRRWEERQADPVPGARARGPWVPPGGEPSALLQEPGGLLRGAPGAKGSDHGVTCWRGAYPVSSGLKP